MKLWLKDGVIMMNSLGVPLYTEDCPCVEAGTPMCTHCQAPAPQLQLTVPAGTLAPGGTATCLSCSAAEGVFICDVGPGVGCVWYSPLVSTCNGKIFRWTVHLNPLSGASKILIAYLEVRSDISCAFILVARFSFAPIPGSGFGVINCQVRLAHLVLTYDNNPSGNTSRCVSSSGKAVTIDAL